MKTTTIGDLQKILSVYNPEMKIKMWDFCRGEIKIDDLYINDNDTLILKKQL